MRLKVQQGSFTSGEVAEADDIAYVVVMADDGTPIMAIEQVGRDHVQVTKANEPTFSQIMRRLGVEVGRVTA